MQTFNYHTHTYRCGHAVGNEEEYVLKAIEAGLDTLGFSEHMGYLGWDDPKERIPFLELDKYIDDINKLKVKYQDKIKIYTGFEFEYFDDSLDHLKKYHDKCDYMICGQHAYNCEEMYYDNPEYCSDEYIDIMSKQVEKALDANLCKYVAHLDYFMLSGFDLSDSKKESIKRICEAVNRNNGIIEINLKGMKYGRVNYNNRLQYKYPRYDVFKIVSDYKCKVCFGYDAHNPEDLLNRQREITIMEEFKDLNLNIIDKLDIKDLR